MTGDEAIENAVRLLEAAEMESDRDRMGLLTDLANSWAEVAGLCYDRENQDLET